MVAAWLMLSTVHVQDGGARSVECLVESHAGIVQTNLFETVSRTWDIYRRLLNNKGLYIVLKLLVNSMA